MSGSATASLLLTLVRCRSRSSLEALEQQVVLSRESLSDKDDEIRRLKALARQLEGSRFVVVARSNGGVVCHIQICVFVGHSSYL